MPFDPLFVLPNSCGCEIRVFKGNLPSPTGIDFVTKYFDPAVSQKARTPKHEHIIADTLARCAAHPDASGDLLTYFGEILREHVPAKSYPEPTDIGRVDQQLRRKLVGSMEGKYLFHVEDLLLAYELIVWQELTRYPRGSLSRKLLELLQKRDLFYAVGLATLKRA